MRRYQKKVNRVYVFVLVLNIMVLGLLVLHCLMQEIYELP